MVRRVAATALLVLVAFSNGGCFATSSGSTGISHLGGSSLDPFGVRERCPQGGDCSDQAIAAFAAALRRLGPEIKGTPLTTTVLVGEPGRLYVNITSDPQLEWQSTSGAKGTGGGFMIDLTDANPYVVVAPGQAIRLRDEDAAAIRDALFVER